MNNKSLIQLQLEAIQVKGKFAEELNNILENYNIQDSVFGIVEGHLHELSVGYFVPLHTYDNVEESIRNMNASQALRVIENNQFIVGDVYHSINECGDCEHIFNIEFLEDVY